MRLSRKKILIIFATPLITPFLLYLCYDIIFFLPNRYSAKKLLDANPVYHQLPSYVPQLIKVAHTDIDGIYASVARNLFFRYGHKPNMGSFRRIIEYFLWGTLTKLHIPEKDIHQYYLLLAYNGDDTGANELSIRLFQTPISQISMDQAALIISVLWHPTQFYRNNTATIARKEKLLLNFNSRYKLNDSR